jgi:hypothetical protein
MNILRFKAYLGLAILLSFIGLLFCFRSISSAQSSPKMEFSIVLENSECKLEEPIYATFKLKNTGTIPAYVNKRFYLGSEEAPKEKREVFFIITSPLSTKLYCKYSYETGLPKSEYFQLLQPGEEASSEFKRDLRAYFDFTETGTYQIVAVYQNVYGKEIGLDVFSDKAISRPVSLKILPKD